MFGWMKKFKASYENPATPLSNPGRWLVDWAGNGTFSGVNISETNAIRSTAVYACVSIIAQSISTLPLMIYRRDGDAREVATDNPVYAILHDRPNTFMTSVVFRELLATHVLLTGNAYAVIGRNGGNQAVDLVPVDPRSVTIERKNGRFIYKIQLNEGGTETVDQSDVLHIKGVSFDGIKGVSPITAVAKQAIGLGLATEEHGARMFSNAAKPGGVLETDKQLSNEGFKRLKESFAAQYSGLENVGKTPLLEEGVKFKSVTINAQDAQYLETRRFQVAEIARVFRVPPHMIGEQEKNTSWGSGIEQQSIGFVTYTLRSWLTKFEQEYNAKLLTPAKGRSEYYAEHNVDGLLRGDSKTRAETLKSYVQGGIITPNEARAKLGFPPKEGGDSLVIQKNMSPLEQLEALSDAA